MGNTFGSPQPPATLSLEPVATQRHELQTREELELYAENELKRASHNITTKCKAYLDSRESKVNELDSELRLYKRQLHAYHQNEKELLNQIEVLKATNRSIENELEQEKKKNSKKQNETISKLKRIIEDKDKEILKLQSLIDPAQQMRRKGHCIRPGDITHEEVSLKYKDLYADRKLFTPLGISETSKRIPELTKLLHVAYNCCKDRVLETAKEELAKLFEMPQTIYSIDDRRLPEVYQPWQSRQEALSLLLSLREEKPTFPDQLVDEVNMECYNGSQIDEMKGVIEKVTKFAWDMVTLSPPVSFGNPPPEMSISEDFYEISDITGQLQDDSNQGGNYTVEYRRPVLFFGPLGTVGQKGNVFIHPPCKELSNLSQVNQNLQMARAETPHQNDSSLSSEQETEGSAQTSSSINEPSNSEINGGKSVNDAHVPSKENTEMTKDKDSTAAEHLPRDGKPVKGVDDPMDSKLSADSTSKGSTENTPIDAPVEISTEDTPERSTEDTKTPSSPPISTISVSKESDASTLEEKDTYEENKDNGTECLLDDKQTTSTGAESNSSPKKKNKRNKKKKKKKKNRRRQSSGISASDLQIAPHESNVNTNDSEGESTTDEGDNGVDDQDNEAGEKNSSEHDNDNENTNDLDVD